MIRTRIYNRNFWLAPVSLCAALSAGLWFYTVDDAYIVFRYARNLVDGHGAVFNPGERVEGFSSPLWFGVTAAARALDLPLETTPKAVSLLVVSAMFIAVARRVQFALAALPLMILACHAPLLVGIVSGLETAMSPALIGLMLVSAHPRIRRGHIVLGALAILCRPENGLLVGIHGVYLWCSRPDERQRLRVAAATWSFTLAALTIARYEYYGALLPNTAVAKLQSGASTVSLAMAYCGDWLGHHGWILLLALPALFFAQTRRMAVNGWLLMASQVAFVFLAGGDWMPQHRFMLPVGIIAGILGCVGLRQALSLERKLIRRNHRIGMAWPLTTAVTAAALVFLAVEYRATRWALDYYHRQLQIIDEGPARYLTYSATESDIVVARDIGLLGYRTQAKVLDLVGLTNAHVARTSGLRHRNQLDVDYIYAQEPAFFVLQSEETADGGRGLGRLSQIIESDVRFANYRRCGRWSLPGRHFCEIYERRPLRQETIAAVEER